MGGGGDEEGRKRREDRGRKRKTERVRDTQRTMMGETDRNGKEHIQTEGMETAAEKWRLKDAENGIGEKRRARNSNTS